MHTQNFIIDERGDWQMVKEINELFPQLHIIPSFAFVPETVYFRYILALVVAPQHIHFVRVLYLVCEQKTNCLDALLPPVNVIAQK
jgi:hypothetical protein